MIQNITRRTPPNPEELAAREQWLAEQRAVADLLNEQLMTAHNQQREAEFQNSLVEKTMLSLEQLRGIREWLRHNS
jgi:hypothetical protein